MDVNLEEKISIELPKGELLVIFEFLAKVMPHGVHPGKKMKIPLS